MAEQKSEGGGGLLANPGALLALVTIAGGLWLVSRNLTSDRPVTPAGVTIDFFGDQKLEARLWEDPFSRSAAVEGKSSANVEGKSCAAESIPVASGLDALVEQIQRRVDSAVAASGRDNAKPADSVARSVLLLPVMVSGGQYSEDQESRIRSRFAIVSALGQAGYAPEDAEHIGALQIPWLTQLEMEQAKKATGGGSADLARLWEQEPATAADAKIRLLGTPMTARSARMEVRYEWYRPRAFSDGTPGKQVRAGILVLWLDDSYFEDDPLLRLPLLLERLIDPAPYPKNAPPMEVALIGPRRSSTLRSMLPDWKTGVGALSELPNCSLEPLAGKVLQRIDVFCATPSAMDEVLVNNPRNADSLPREAVRRELTAKGLFRSFRNFAATDAQLAHEILDELKLRNVDLADPTNHVVLISEWDTFYARMLSLTYRAELALRQPAALPSRAAFVADYISKLPPPDGSPKNFHSFVYLRGLDGQTVGGEGRAREADSESRRSGKTPPSSIEELRHWVPDVNKAEGRAQFDYLGRLGDQLTGLQKSLRHRDEGEIKAVGIVGSDVYDILLILQALRRRFPDVLFFTTDLDVRFFHPSEREWARNLIVASSYGLALDDNLQGTVAPFRDSTQTAQFAAALAALGNDRLAGMGKIPPRRFEVGNRTAVDLSADSDPPAAVHPPDPHAFRLHPMTTSEKYRSRSNHYFRRLRWGLLAAVLLLAGASWVWAPLCRVTWDAWIYPGEALNYSEEDIGGPDGAEALAYGLLSNKKISPAARLIAGAQIDDLPARLETLDTEASILRAALNQSTGKPTDLPLGKKKSKDRLLELESQREKTLTELMATLVELLNQELSQKKIPEEKAGPAIAADTSRQLPADETAWRRWLHGRRRLAERRKVRQKLDAFLFEVAPPLQPKAKKSTEAGEATAISAKPAAAPDKERIKQAVLQAAVAARLSAVELFKVRSQSLTCFWISAVCFGLLAFGLSCVIWYDSFHRATGEQFSLTNGTSAWPAQIVRLLVVALAVCFIFGQSHKMRETFHTLTRRYRFSSSPDETARAAGGVCADTIWQSYRDRSDFKLRWPWILSIALGYFLLLCTINLAFGESIFSPTRGGLIDRINFGFLLISIFGFLVLAFLTMDTAALCRRFIEELSARPTHYPEATRRHFSRQMGRIKDEYLDEWIDLQLIADLTEQVGRLVYFPAGLVLLLVLARNSWWDCWTWPVVLVVVYGLNTILALASVVILQCAAKDAKRKAEESLTAKVKKLQAQAAPSAAQNNAAQAEKLLDEIRQLERGAFVPFWENPVVGAVFLSSGGTTMLQIFIWFMGR